MASVPQSWGTSFGHDPAELIDLFLFTNVFTFFFFTDVARVLGLKRVITGAGALMCVGAFLRSGVPFSGTLPSYVMIQAGTVFVGAARPFFQCTPPLLSATWFGSEERALSTATAINFNQVGIAAAFIVGGPMGQDYGGLVSYFSIISVLTLLVVIGAFLQATKRGRDRGRRCNDDVQCYSATSGRTPV